MPLIYPIESMMGLSDVFIKLKKLDVDQIVDDVWQTTSTPLDDTYLTAETVLKGQPRFLRHKDQEPTSSGDGKYTQGYFTVTTKELVRKLVYPERLRNALVVGYEIPVTFQAKTRVEVQFRVTEIRPRGHLPGGPVIYKVFVETAYDIIGGV